MLKSLSTTQKLYLFLVNLIGSIITMVLSLLLYKSQAIDFLENNIWYKLFMLLFNAFISINIASITDEFKKWAIFNILASTISFGLVLINTPIMIFDYFLSDILEFVLVVLNIPIAYFYYKGFCTITKNKNALYNSWKKIGIIFFVISIIMVPYFFISRSGRIMHIILPELIHKYSIPMEVVLILIVCSSLGLVVIEIIRYINIFKTIKLYKNIENNEKTQQKNTKGRISCVDK